MASTSSAAEAEAEVRSILERAVASSFLPLHAIHHLLSVGVCVRCIFRLFGAYSSACSCASLTASVLHTFLEERDDSIKKDSCTCLSTNDAYCSICLGILVPACHQDGGTQTPNGASHFDDIPSMISEVVQRENYQIDEFFLEISLLPVIAVNERAVRLYMKQKYGNENWLNDKPFPQQTMSVKEALRLLIIPSLEKQMNAKHGSNSFRIRLTYVHDDASQKLHSLVPFYNGLKRTADDGGKHAISETDSLIYKTLEGIQDQEFCNLVQLPPEKVHTHDTDNIFASLFTN